MLKETVLNLMVGLDAFSAFRFVNRAKLPILMYHRFSESQESGKTSRQTFETHLSYLTKNYKIISMTDAVRYLTDGNSLPNRSAVLTIDDGYRDFYDVAFPVLKNYNVPATLYLVTGFVNRDCWIWTDKARYLLGNTRNTRFSFGINGKYFDEELGDSDSRLSLAGRVNFELKKIPDHEKETILKEIEKWVGIHLDIIPSPEFGPVSWEQVRELSDGGVEIGSHTINHPILTNVDAEILTDELTRSKTELEDKLQAEICTFVIQTEMYRFANKTRLKMPATNRP